MNKVCFILCLCLFFVACNKKQPLPAKPSTPAATYYFEANYKIYDSLYHWQSTGNGYKDTNIHSIISRTINVFMDSTTNYVVSGTDTFKYQVISNYFKGYYKYFRSPMDYKAINLTNDSVRILIGTYEGGNVITTTRTSFGYRLP